MSIFGNWLERLGISQEISDEQAMWRVQNEDDPHAFGILMERHQERIRSLCYRMVGDVHRAEDLAQETFSRIYAKRKSYACAAKFSTYLWRVAVNLCYDELRRRKRRGEISIENGRDDGTCLLDQSPDESSPPSESLESTERAELVKRALMELPEAYRSVVVLRHYEDLRFREIAEVLEVPEGTVKSRMSEAMSLLHRKLSISLSTNRSTPLLPKQGQDKTEALFV